MIPIRPCHKEREELPVHWRADGKGKGESGGKGGLVTCRLFVKGGLRSLFVLERGANFLLLSSRDGGKGGVLKVMGK